MCSTTSDKLAGVSLKIERAKHHIQELNVVIREFLNSNPYSISKKADPNAGKLVYYVTRAECTPPQIPIIAGEAINGLRSALDHLAMQFAISFGESAGRISFPIGAPAKDKAQIGGIIRGKGKPVVDAIYALEAYQGGKGGDLWELHELNNIDKHRLLIAVGSTFSGVDMGLCIAKSLADSFPGLEFPGISFVVKPPRLSLLKAGAEIVVLDAKVDEQIKFTFDVSFSEPQIAEPKPVLESLMHFANRVEAVVKTLGDLL